MTRRPLELLNLMMLGVLILLTPITLRERPGNWLLLALYIVMAAVLLQYRRLRLPGLDFPRLFVRAYPLIYIAVIFDSLAHLAPYVRSWRADAFLRAIDRRLLGVDPTVYLERYANRWAVELMAYVYLLYFILPFVLVWLLWRRRRLFAEITDWACTLTIALYANYLLYLIFPAQGPRFEIAHAGGELEGVAFANFIMHSIYVLESNKFDVFPSAHVCAGLVTWYGFHRYLRRYSVAVAVAVVGIMVSTVYLRYHYFVDVLAGIVLAAAAISVAGPYCRLWYVREAEPIESLGEELAP